MTAALVLLTLAAAAPPSAFTRVDTCAALAAPQQARAQALLDRLHPYDCCDDTLQACLPRATECPVVTRLLRQVCAGVAAGQTDVEIEHALTRRGQSVLGVSRPVRIALDPAMCAGVAEAPVVVAVYACARCPFCSKRVPELYREVVDGSLRGKARLCLRPFPIKDHPGSLDGGLAMVAAARAGGFWPYTLQLYARYDAFRVDALDAWAGDVGLDREAFARARGDGAAREALAESKREGLRNKVTSTPTVFIDGRRYVHELDAASLVDVIDEVHAARARPAPP